MLCNLRIYKELREQRVREQLAAEDAKIPVILDVSPVWPKVACSNLVALADSQ